MGTAQWMETIAWLVPIIAPEENDLFGKPCFSWGPLVSLIPYVPILIFLLGWLSASFKGRKSFTMQTETWRSNGMHLKGHMALVKRLSEALSLYLPLWMENLSDLYFQSLITADMGVKPAARGQQRKICSGQKTVHEGLLSIIRSSLFGADEITMWFKALAAESWEAEFGSQHPENKLEGLSHKHLLLHPPCSLLRSMYTQVCMSSHSLYIHPHTHINTAKVNKHKIKEVELSRGEQNWAFLFLETGCWGQRGQYAASRRLDILIVFTLSLTEAFRVKPCICTTVNPCDLGYAPITQDWTKALHL